MSLNNDFKSEYLKALCATLDIVKQNEGYDAFLSEYKKLTESINAHLEAIDSPVTDAHALIDEGGKIAYEAMKLISQDEKILSMLKALEGLYVRKLEFAKLGFVGDAAHNLKAVASIGKYRDMEKKIISELGLDDGRTVIYEVKSDAVEYEKTLGITFFEPGVQKLRDIMRIKRLYPTDGEIELDYQDNLNTWPMILNNSQGEAFHFERCAEMRHRGITYLELELYDELNVCKFNYYEIKKDEGLKYLLLVEDEQKLKLLEEIRDGLCGRFQR